MSEEFEALRSILRDFLAVFDTLHRERLECVRKALKGLERDMPNFHPI
jgi:hypothetical protein